MQTRDILAFPSGNPILLKKDQDLDELFEDAAKVIIEDQNASASFLQRKLNIGYARSARILDELQEMGIVGPADGAKPREVNFKNYIDYTNYKAGTTPDTKVGEDDFSHYVLPKVKLDSLGFEPEVWKIPFGINQSNQSISTDLEKLGHLLIIGNPHSQKMEFIDTLLCSQLLCCTPAQIRFLIIDQSNHLQIYNGVPHLLTRVIENSSKSHSAFWWAQAEVDRRFKFFNQVNVRTFREYNEVSGGIQLPRIVFIVRLCEEPDKTIQSSIVTLTSKASAAGIHLVLIYDFAGRRYISSEIKANIPNVLAFHTTSSNDSKFVGVIGAEKLALDDAILKGDFQEEQSKIKWYRFNEADVRMIISEII